MDYAIELTLSYDGKSSKEHHIDLYDVSQALTGFQRSLALTTHLILNNKVIVQSPSLKGAEIMHYLQKKAVGKLQLLLF